MEPTRRHFARLALAVTAAFAFGAAHAQATYNVGATATGVPFTFLDVKTNSIQGMMVDTAQAVAQAAGFKVTVQRKRSPKALWKRDHCMSTIVDRARRRMVCT